MKRPIVSEDLLQLRFASDPQISPDGRRVAYALTHIDAETKAYKTDLYVIDTETRQSRRLTVGANNPVWSPDGKYLAFVSDRSGSRQIWLLPDGLGEAEQLTTMRWGAGNPQWSPDGKKILFTSAVGEEDTPELLTQEMTKAEREKLQKDKLDQPYVVDTLRYKMNGVGLLPKRTGQLFVLDVATKSVQQLTSGDYSIHSAAWSPCGQYVAFTSNRLPDPDLHPSISDLYVLSIADQQMTKLTESDGSASRPIWSLDGQDIVYLWHDGRYKGATLSKFYRIPAQGGEAVCLDPDMELPVGTTANGDSRYGRNSMLPVWATNGYIYFVAAAQGHANFYRLAAKGGNVEEVSQLHGAIYGFTLDNEGKRAAIALTEPLVPGDIHVFDLVTKESVRLTHVNDEYLQTVALSTPEEFSVTSFDGTKLQAWIMQPVNFEPGVKYPTILKFTAARIRCLAIPSF